MNAERPEVSCSNDPAQPGTLDKPPKSLELNLAITGAVPNRIPQLATILISRTIRAVLYQEDVAGHVECGGIHAVVLAIYRDTLYPVNPRAKVQGGSPRTVMKLLAELPAGWRPCYPRVDAMQTSPESWTTPVGGRTGRPVGGRDGSERPGPEEPGSLGHFSRSRRRRSNRLRRLDNPPGHSPR